ncbi:thap domain-containing protein 9 [Holotrichia oblita]|uniref:Thap domain-containing protein 9 n=1 Tax=Holotrichia oblita TaxID=644536 RepID=A0ACB9SKH8_HOLOL|nr:thap domain-containing protein 9 [Holotrichia oblita]
MSIEPHLFFNGKEFIGFEDMGDASTDRIADHAQVYILRSISGKWKQPIAYNFSRASTTTVDLARIMQSTITKCFEVELIVIATVSDQGSNNVAAINYLMQNTVPVQERHENTERKFFYVNGRKITHIFDPPHLLKGIRNNLLRSNLVWMNENEIFTASWEVIYTVYQMDNMSGQLRSLPKLTEEHVNPDKIRKMKVSHAAQVFSHSVAAVMNLLLTTGKGSRSRWKKKIKPTSSSNSEVLKFFDTLFDSVNGMSIPSANQKRLRCAMSSISGHMEFWAEAKKALKNMYFEDKKSNRKQVPSRNWLITINGIHDIFDILKRSYSMTILRTRVFNQDPLEFFFW